MNQSESQKTPNIVVSDCNASNDVEDEDDESNEDKATTQFLHPSDNRSNTSGSTNLLNKFGSSVLSLYSVQLGHKKKVIFANFLMVFIVGMLFGAFIIKFFLCTTVDPKNTKNSKFQLGPL